MLDLALNMRGRVQNFERDLAEVPPGKQARSYRMFPKGVATGEPTPLQSIRDRACDRAPFILHRHTPKPDLAVPRSRRTLGSQLRVLDQAHAYGA
jgi:hypothetical protein